MSRRHLAAVVLACLASLPLGAGRAGAAAVLAAAAPAVPRSAPAEVRAFVVLVNRHRAMLGLPPLQWDARVAAVARAHSRDMARRGYFAHTSPDGVDPFERLSAAGITWSAAGENIAHGQPTAAAVMAGWLSSRRHRANLENADYTHHGVGLVGTHWTHVFIRRR